VLAVSALLDDLGGRDTAVLSIEIWRTCFDVHLASSGQWPIGLTGSARWLLAEDDQQGRYLGTRTGGSRKPTWSRMDLSFAPTLDPSATSLTFEFPNPFDGNERVWTTIDFAHR
jgi:hypothetical protein